MNKPRIAIVDFGMNNLFSIYNGLKKAGSNPFITSDKDDILLADGLVLPGVGAFNRAIEFLDENKLTDSIKAYANSGKYVLGICLGMQLLMDSSEEFGFHNGLGLIKGTCKKFNSNKLKVPHIMWNSLNIIDPKDDLLNIQNSKEMMYFIHSYYVNPDNKKSILSMTNYNGFEFCSAFQQNKVIGVQFHPEKSGLKGLEFLEKFIKKINYNEK